MYMKKIIITKIMNYIKKKTNYSKTELEKIQYGIVSIYLTISKFLWNLLGIKWAKVFLAFKKEEGLTATVRKEPEYMAFNATIFPAPPSPKSNVLFFREISKCFSVSQYSLIFFFIFFNLH